jgi:hypothetical protein
MNIALDYDDTYTRDRKFWEEFISLCKTHGHKITCITKRGKDNQGETCTDISIPVVYSNRMAKAHYCAHNQIPVDIWIDDSPQNLFVNG